MIQRTRIFFIAALLCAARPLPGQEARPVLQILNGSQQTLDVFWLKSDTERVANGSIAPGQDTTITTTLGHRFADRKSTRLNSSHSDLSRMPSSA